MEHFSDHEMVEFNFTLVLWLLMMTTDILESLAATNSLSREIGMYSVFIYVYMCTNLRIIIIVIFMYYYNT